MVTTGLEIILCAWIIECLFLTIESWKKKEYIYDHTHIYVGSVPITYKLKIRMLCES